MLTRNVKRWQAFLLAAVVAAPMALADSDAMDKEKQDSLSPQETLEAMMEGNERFLAEEMLERDLAEQVKDTAGGQYPHSVVLGCIDSRVPPEIVFDQGVGDIFSARVAGNFVTAELLGSIEYGTAVAGSNLIIVLGHTACGAVKGAADNVKLGNITHTLAGLAPAVYAVTDVEGERSSKNKDYVNAIVHENVRQNVKAMTEQSPVITELVEKGEVMVVGAVYDVKTGTVTLLEDEEAE